MSLSSIHDYDLFRSENTRYRGWALGVSSEPTWAHCGLPGGATSGDFGAALRQLRRERQVSLRALARRVNYDFGYIAQVERGERAGSEDLARLCDEAFRTGRALRDAYVRDLYGSASAHLPTTAHTSGPSSPAVLGNDEVGAYLTSSHTLEGETADMDSSRRGFLQAVGGIAAVAAVTASTPLRDSLSDLRSRADTLLDTQSVSSASLDAWEDLAEHYGVLELTAAPALFLEQVGNDFNNIQLLLSQRQPLRTQRRLYRVMAQYAGLIAIVSNDLGWNSQPWLSIARRAAGEAEDDALAAWTMTYQSMAYLWNGNTPKAVQIAQEAQARVRSRTSGAKSLAAAMEARAQSRLGRQAETLSAVRRSDEIFERLHSADTRVNVLGIYEHILRFFQSNALTAIGMTDAAFDAQEQAFNLAQGNVVDVVDAGLLRMDRAMCLMRNGDQDEGCRIAAETLDSFPVKSRTELIARRAQEILGTASHGAHSSELRELLKMTGD